MKWLAYGENYNITNESAHIESVLPAGVYNLNQDPNSGILSLSKRLPFTINEKVYGVHQEKIDKVKDAYHDFNRSLGVILSGDKGIGKSLFSKMLCMEMVDENIPVIIIDRYYQGLSRFIENIDNDVVCLFDEFDKMFDEKRDMQVEFLSLFDGVTSRKRLYIITCNSLDRLNSFLVNRPGRFHYHFRFNYPTPQEIEEYLDDHIDDKWDNKEINIRKTVELSSKFQLNYDCLRSMAFEMNRGRYIKEALMDLNIMGDTRCNYICKLVMNDGSKFEDRDYGSFDMTDTGIRIYEFYDKQYRKNLFDVDFVPAECEFKNNRYYINLKSVNTNIKLRRIGENRELYTKLLEDAGFNYYDITKENPDKKVKLIGMTKERINNILSNYGFERIPDGINEISESKFNAVYKIMNTTTESNGNLNVSDFIFDYAIEDIKSIELVPIIDNNIYKRDFLDYL